MKKNERGQAAVEYLIILAVVIIIALVVVGVLGGFPALTRGVSERESAVYWQGSDIGLVRFTASGTNVTAIIRNNRNFNARNFSTTQFGTGTGISNAYTGNLGPGESSNGFTQIGTLPAGTCASVGETWSVFPVRFTYVDSQYGTTYTFIGAKPLSGTCS